MAGVLLRNSCRGLLFGGRGSLTLRSKAIPLLAAIGQKMTRGSNYTKHWFDERAVAIGLLACIPVGIVYPCAPVDYALGVLVPVHNYWGIHHVIIDYCPRSALTIVELMWKALFAVQLGGLAYINYYDVGICKLVAMTLGI
eukprot:gene16279-7663_t